MIETSKLVTPVISTRKSNYALVNAIFRHQNNVVMTSWVQGAQRRNDI